MTSAAAKVQNATSRSPWRRRRSRGQTTTEFLFVALPLLMLLFGIAGFGLAIYSYSFVCDAARDAVRYAIVHGASSTAPASASDIQNYVDNEAVGFDSSNLTVSTTWSPDNKPGSVVSVQVTYDFQPLYPISPVTLPLTSTAQMVISR